MRLDWIQWNFFLKMLSSERTEPFVDELALPFQTKDFRAVRRVARGCLEFVVFCSPGLRDEPGSKNLVDAWQRYREVAGVLSEAKLLEFEARYGRSPAASIAIYSEFQDAAGPTSNAIKKWFVNNFRSGPDPVREWPWALRLLIGEPDQEVIPATPVPLDKKQRQYVEDFCRRYRTEQLALEIRFYDIAQSSVATGPSPWERVLQSYPADEGTLNYFPWLDAIEKCLQYRLIRYEWEKLTLDLGMNAMVTLTRWLRMNSKVLPFGRTLPDEPLPLATHR